MDQSTTAWFALAELKDAGSLRLGILARRLGIGQPAASALVRRLESRGWIERVDDPLDRRATELRLTALGSDALTGWHDATAAALARAVDDLDQADQAVLQQALVIVVQRRARLSALGTAT